MGAGEAFDNHHCGTAFGADKGRCRRLHRLARLVGLAGGVHGGWNQLRGKLPLSGTGPAHRRAVPTADSEGRQLNAETGQSGLSCLREGQRPNAVTGTARTRGRCSGVSGRPGKVRRYLRHEGKT